MVRGRDGSAPESTRRRRRGIRRRSRGRLRSRVRRLLLACLALAAVGVGAGAALWASLPDPAALAESWPAETAYMEIREEEARRADRPFDRLWRPVPLSRVPRHVRRAVWVAEDAMFYRHDGVDWYEVRVSVQEWWSDDESLRGASTITMQLARNLYLSPDRSLWRKLREVLIALRLEDALDKDRILELYLSVVELGPGVFGVEAAARHYWDVGVAELDRRQAAELAATLPAPRVDNPRTRTRRFRWRADLVERRAFGSRPSDASGVLRSRPRRRSALDRHRSTARGSTR